MAAVRAAAHCCHGVPDSPPCLRPRLLLRRTSFLGAGAGPRRHRSARPLRRLRPHDRAAQGAGWRSARGGPGPRLPSEMRMAQLGSPPSCRGRVGSRLGGGLLAASSRQETITGKAASRPRPGLHASARRWPDARLLGEGEESRALPRDRRRARSHRSRARPDNPAPPGARPDAAGRGGPHGTARRVLCPLRRERGRLGVCCCLGSTAWPVGGRWAAGSSPAPTTRPGRWARSPRSTPGSQSRSLRPSRRLTGSPCVRLTPSTGAGSGDGAPYGWRPTRRCCSRSTPSPDGTGSTVGEASFQYQSVLPLESARDAVAEMLETVARAGEGSFLAVLKTMGPRRSPGLLSFPMLGTTLALNLPNRGAPVLALLDRLDETTRATAAASTRPRMGA